MADHGRISDQIYVIPFGRYTAASDVAPPANQVLVGRESQRAYLIEMLISAGRRGAFLVTGRRGAGKSSFVRHCIGEYQAAVFNRFLRANVGRGILDRALVLFFLLLLLFTGLLASELLQIIRTPRLDTPFGPIAWLMVGLLAALLFYPAVYAKLVVETLLFQVLRRRSYRATDKGAIPKARARAEALSSQIAGAWSTLLVMAAVLAVWLVPAKLFRSPNLSLSSLLAVTAATYYAVQAFSFYAEKSLWRARLGVAFGVLVVTGSLLLCATRNSLNDSAYVALAITFVVAGLLLRFFHLRWLPSAPRSLQEATRSASVAYLLPALLLLACLLIFATDLESIWALLAIPIVGCLWPLFRLRSRLRSHDSDLDSSGFHPPPAAVLVPKALLSILISVQLARPALGKVGRVLPIPIQNHLGLNDVSPWLFAGRADEIWWLVLAVLLLGFLAFLEYEWILRPYEWTRIPTAQRPSWAEVREVQASELPPGEASRIQRSLASLTLPWLLYRMWLPSTIVSVNLGFDRLGHSQVIQAMLVGLRDRYYRSFLAWSSSFANLGRLLGALLVLAAVTVFGHIWFEPPSRNQLAAAQESYSSGASRNRNQPLTTCDLLESQANPEHTSAAGLICSAGELWFNLAYFNLLPAHLFEHSTGQPGSFLLHDFLPYSPAQSPTNPRLAHSGALLPKGPHFAVYHVLLLVLFFFLGRWVFRRLPAFPYHQNLRRIDDVLDSLSARQRTTSRTDLWGPARWIYSLFTDERVRESEREPLDPRAVELAFLEVLEEIQKGGIRMPGAARHHLTIPSPEITFVFDELDKLGTRTDPEESPSLPESSRIQREVLHHERLRSIRLRSLLSDLKNILSAAPARFIFVGGRNLHDEWLADHTSRQPLLTSIFNAEVYLPSLLTERTISRRSDLNALVHDYVNNHVTRAKALYRMWALRRWRPSFGLWIEDREHDTFTQGDLQSSDLDLYRFQARPLIAELPSSPQSLDPNVRSDFYDDFVNFLAFRSMGNPKQLYELLTTFIVPASARLQATNSCPNLAASRHVLEFNDHAVFRIQLVSDIYRHLVARFSPRMYTHMNSVSSTPVDDKYAISLFFMTDFLFKFHRRAFSWSNLERVDDLANIHRLPDLREAQAELVDHFSERFLHRVLNGMYTFRFRSDVAREVEYISRKSPFELASLNFTLDESQSLKGLYQAALKEQDEQNSDLLGGLGELYDFDQEFEPARYHYRKALDFLDRTLFTKVRGTSEPAYGQSDYSVIRSVLAGSAPHDARIFLSWGTARLRLMLQIGLSYERERNLERAATEYRDARTLARALVRSCVPADDHAAVPPWYQSEGDETWAPYNQRLHTLKGLHLFFQPVFAEAWLSEKVVGVVDTSVSLVERSLSEIRDHLPYVKQPVSLPGTDPRKPLHGNFLLTLSQLHNRAGDLYFFKGRQPASEAVISDLLKEEIAGESTQGSDRTTDGYIVRAHYHYAVAMHEIRRYVWYRVESSSKLSISKSSAPTLVAEALPDFVYRAAAGSLNDMAEATLARVSLTRLSRRLRRADAESTRKLIELIRLDLESLCPKWLGQDDNASAATLSNWFGQWLGISGENGKLISFVGPDPDEQRLLMSLKLCFVGSNLFAEGGYPEDAGREFLQICDTVTRYLWWRRTFLRVARGEHSRHLLGNRWGNLLSELPSEVNGERSRLEMMFWSQLITLGIRALQKADYFFRASRGHSTPGKAGAGSQAYLLGEVLPVSAMTLLCSLALAAEGILDEKQTQDLKRLRGEWVGHPKPGANEDDFATPLRSSLERHRYPMINRLHGIKVLVDHAAVTNNLWGIAAYTDELLDLSSQFDAPLHFTPFHSGTTCALVWIASQDLHWEVRATMPELDRIRRAAVHDLRVSEEMYTMRRSYYESISDLYYLYDDFNDRQIHFNHAIQMAGSELAAILRYLVENWDKSCVS